MKKKTIKLLLILISILILTIGGFNSCKENKNNNTQNTKEEVKNNDKDIEGKENNTKEKEQNENNTKEKEQNENNTKEKENDKDIEGKENNTKEKEQNENNTKEKESLGIDFTKLSVNKLKRYHALIETKFGEIELEFYPELAPNHVKSFLKLADSGFYDGCTFHRVIPGFMIQGGDPNSKDDDPNNDGTGGPGYTIKAEFNDIPHERGILSMARSQHPDSAGSQFFIVQKDSSFLDKKYTVFGRVVEGIEIVDKIADVKTGQNDRPINNVRMKVSVVKLKNQ